MGRYFQPLLPAVARDMRDSEREGQGRVLLGGGRVLLGGGRGESGGERERESVGSQPLDLMPLGGVRGGERARSGSASGPPAAA